MALAVLVASLAGEGTTILTVAHSKAAATVEDMLAISASGPAAAHMVAVSMEVNHMEDNKEAMVKVCLPKG